MTPEVQHVRNKSTAATPRGFTGQNAKLIFLLNTFFNIFMQCFVCGVSALLWSAAFIMNTYSSLMLMLSVLHSALPIKPSFPLSSSLLLAPQTGNRCPSFPVSVHGREPGQCGYIYSCTRTQQYNTRSPLSRQHIRTREQHRWTNRR